MARRFMGLTPAQSDAFERIAICQPPNASRKTLEALEKMGLIVGHDVPTYGPTSHPLDRIPMMVREYAVPLPIHYQWCQWCTEQVGG